MQNRLSHLLPSEGSTPDRQPQYAVQLYERAWQAYREAGRPFGESDVAMLIWFMFNQYTRNN